MRRVIGIALLAIALMLGNFTLTSANASDDDDVIRLLAKTVVDEYLDLGPTGESFGDQLVFSDDLYLDGDRAGTLDGNCTFTRVVANVSAMVNCSVTLTLPDGQITLQGAIGFDEDTDSFTIAITGGTGDYDDAQGQVKVRFINDTDTKLKVMLN